MYIRFFLFYCAILFSYSTIFAQAPNPIDIKAYEAFPSSTISRERSEDRRKLTTEDLEAFFDGFIPLQIEQANVAGAVISVVKDGINFFKRLWVRRYSQKNSDLLLKKPFSVLGQFQNYSFGQHVMQHVEQGKLDLDRDVNDYLDFKIPQAFDKPITLRDIMTHRAGFEETIKDLFVGSPGGFASLISIFTISSAFQDLSTRDNACLF